VTSSAPLVRYAGRVPGSTAPSGIVGRECTPGSCEAVSFDSVHPISWFGRLFFSHHRVGWDTARREAVMIKDLFDRAAEDYDRARRQLVPCFDDFYGTVLDLIPRDREAAVRILDLGAGTGLLAALVAEAFPRADFTLVDISDAMLERARRRFAAEPTRFHFRALDFEKEPLPGEYDVVVSALSIHHVDDGAKRGLFQRVYDVLRQEGIFINADQVLGATPEIDREYHRAWLRQVRSKGVSEDDLAAALERMGEDKMSTLGSQMKWLEDAGFEMVDCWYKSHGFVVYSGRKR
jgi:tRNA (cmo5U34)-methyltransferase